MADYTKDSYYQLSLNILKALGGDISIPFADADAIWEEIYKIYDHAGGRFDIVPLQETITKNGTYDYYPESGADAYMPVNITVSVPQDYTDEDVAEIRQQATIDGYNTGYVEGELSGKEAGFTEGYTSGFTAGETEGYSDGYAEGLDDGVEDQKALLEEIVITDNGVYEKKDGYNKITVEVEGAVTNLGVLQLVESTNGTYEYSVEDYGDGVDGWHTVEVQIDVAQSGWTDEDLNEQYNSGWDQGYEQAMIDRDEAMETIEITENGTYTSSAGFSEVVVAVEGGGDTGKPKIYNGFRFNGGNVGTVDFSQYDWSNVYDTSYFFHNTSNTQNDWSSFINDFNGKILSCNYMFGCDSSSIGVKMLPDLGDMTKDCRDFSYMCKGNKQLNSVNNIANWNTSNAITCESMFAECSNLTYVPVFDTSNVLDMNNMFYMYKGGTPPALNTSKVVDMGYMFAYSNITSLPEYDTSKVTDMQYMCNYCQRLTTVPMLDASSVYDISNIFYECINLTTFGGFKDLGKVPTMVGTATANTFKNVPFSHESLMNIINNLYDRASAGYSVLGLKLYSYNLEKLSDEEIAIATNKGWTLS